MIPNYRLIVSNCSNVSLFIVVPRGYFTIAVFFTAYASHEIMPAGGHTSVGIDGHFPTFLGITGKACHAIVVVTLCDQFTIEIPFELPDKSSSVDDAHRLHLAIVDESCNPTQCISNSTRLVEHRVSGASCLPGLVHCLYDVAFAIIGVPLETAVGGCNLPWPSFWRVFYRSDSTSYIN